MLRTIQKIQRELVRLNATEVLIRLDHDFEPTVGTLIEVTIESSYWHLLPAEFLEIIREIADGFGAEAIKQQIESRAQFVWHGPAPLSRETSV